MVRVQNVAVVLLSRTIARLHRLENDGGFLLVVLHHRRHCCQRPLVLLVLVVVDDLVILVVAIVVAVAVLIVLVKVVGSLFSLYQTNLKEKFVLIQIKDIKLVIGEEDVSVLQDL